MKIIISTCDKYINILEATKYSFNKFGWKDAEVVLLGFKEPKFDIGNWDFISLGVDTGAQNFTNDIWKFFEFFEDEFFIFHGDDGVLLDNVNTELLDEMKQIMIDNSDIMKINITSAFGHSLSHYDTFKDMVEYQYKLVPQGADYRLSLNPSIWRTSYFKKYCKLGISPWDWELRPIAKNDGAILLGTSGGYVLDIGHLFRYGNLSLSPSWDYSEYTGKRLSIEDKKYIENIIGKVKNKHNK